MATATQPLTPEQLYRQAPSIFATRAHRRVSARYQFISTLAIIAGLEREGWLPVHAEESRVRLADRQGFTKHLLRFRRVDQALPMIGDTFPELVLVNAHDGSGAYQLQAGLFRLVCGNGLIIADTALGQVRRRHTGQALSQVLAGTDQLVAALPAIADQVATFQHLTLQPAEQLTLATVAATLRWGQGKAPVSPRRLLQPRRPEDHKNDLWTTYQRVQENLLKGGLRRMSPTGRRLTTPAIRSVDRNLKLNMALWALTAHLAALKAARGY